MTRQFCDCGEPARYRYSRGDAQALICSECACEDEEVYQGWDGPVCLCGLCGDEIDPRDGFRCPRCRAQEVAERPQ